MIAGRWLTALALLALAWSVAVPLTRWFARAAWASRTPASALFAWQAVGLSGGLAVLTAELTLVAAGTAGPWPVAVLHAADHPTSTGPVQLAALALLGLSVAWLLGVLVLSFVRAARARQAHRVLLDVLSRPDRLDDTRVDVIDTAATLAYSVPGRRPHVVLSRAVRDHLGRAELSAVLAHERAHLRLRHNVLVQPFVAWERSLPFLRTPRLARRRVEQLVEMQCDDIACRARPADALRSALARLATTDADADIDQIDEIDGAIDERLSRLAAPRPAPGLAMLVLAGGSLLVLLPPALLLTLR